MQHIQPTDTKMHTVSEAMLPLSNSLAITYRLSGQLKTKLSVQHHCLISPDIQHPIMGQDFYLKPRQLSTSMTSLLPCLAINLCFYPRSRAPQYVEHQLLTVQRNVSSSKCSLSNLHQTGIYSESFYTN